MFELIDECGRKHIKVLVAINDYREKEKSGNIQNYKNQKVYDPHRTLDPFNLNTPIFNHLHSLGLLKDGSHHALTERGDVLVKRKLLVALMHVPFPTKWKGVALAFILASLTQALWYLLSII